MLTQSLHHPCARHLVQPYWADFCEVFSEENQNRLVTVEVLDPDSGEIDTFDPRPLNLMGYDPFRMGNFLTISFGNEEEGRSNHVVTQPKEIDIFYEHGEQIFAVAITDKKKAITVIYFEENAVVIHGQALQLRSLLSLKRDDTLSLV